MKKTTSNRTPKKTRRPKAAAANKPVAPAGHQFGKLVTPKDAVIKDNAWPYAGD